MPEGRRSSLSLEVPDGPLTIIDYIVVHELCHMRHRDHSSAFWNEVDKVLPDYQRRKEWLKARGVELDL
jgi:predicted metal-dependent hydrolase